MRTPVEVSGVGLHTGINCRMRILPADVDTGIVFVRVDVEGRPTVRASYKNVMEERRRTVLSEDGIKIQTVEHLMGALYGAGVTNAKVELDAEEVPDFGGSAAPLYQAILESGVVSQAKAANILRVGQGVRVEEKDVSITAEPSCRLEVVYNMKYDELQLELSSNYIEGEDDFDSIVASRTYCLKSEVELLREMGLGKGAKRENILVLGEDGIEKWRNESEPAKHKILDFIGDMALSGARVIGRFVCNKSGHRLNRRMLVMVAEESVKTKAESDIIEIEQIMEIIPHRFPFLMVDRVVKVDGSRFAVGVKNVTINEPYFQGHFPGRPVMPGVLQIEAMAQLAGVLLMREGSYKGKLPFLMGVDGVKFRRAVVPGDQLVLEAETVRVRGRSGEVKTRALVDGKVASEAVIRFMLVDKNRTPDTET